jgi:hypothetical protein
VRTATVTRLCAVWLGVLAALPFTAPFAALDAADFFGGDHKHTATTVSAGPSSAQDDDADDAAAADAVLQRVHPLALGDLAPISTPLAAGPVSSASTLVATETSALPPLDSSALTTVLRL